MRKWLSSHLSYIHTYQGHVGGWDGISAIIFFVTEAGNALAALGNIHEGDSHILKWTRSNMELLPYGLFLYRDGRWESDCHLIILDIAIFFVTEAGNAFAALGNIHEGYSQIKLEQG